MFDCLHSYLIIAALMLVPIGQVFAGNDNPSGAAPINYPAPLASPAVAAISIAAPIAGPPPAALLSPRYKVLAIVGAASILGAIAYWNLRALPVSLWPHVPLSAQVLSQEIEQCKAGSGLACETVWGELLQLGWDVEFDMHVEEALHAIALTKEGNVVVPEFEFDIPLALCPQRLKLLTLLVQKGRGVIEARSVLAKRDQDPRLKIGIFPNFDWAIFHLKHAVKKVDSSEKIARFQDP